MPNWTANRIYIEGEPNDLREFLAAVRSEERVFDFNRIIPMPELLRRTSTGSTTIEGKKVTSWYVIREASADEPEQLREFTPEEKAVLRDIGHDNWYDWRSANWGTKWNACDPQIEDPRSIEFHFLKITFDTAWSEPEPIFRKLIAAFPRLTFDCRWRHEEDDPYPHSLTGTGGAQ
jgi:hypothetical protein